VKPDIEVEFDPALWRKGEDPQLEKGVAVALENLKEHPVPAIKRPNYPVYSWSKVRADAAKGTPNSSGGGNANQ
jgi:tricorn protease